MWLLPINNFFPVYLMLLLVFGISNGEYGQLVTSDQVAKEGDDEVVLPCDYSQVTPTTPNKITWNEVNEVGRHITSGIVNDVKTINGRYSLRTTPGKADLVIANPIRNDTQRRFQCQIQTQKGDVIDSDPPSIITVYYLDEPVLSASASSVYEGESVTLTCSKPDGDPVPNIAWYKDGQALITTDTTRFDTSEDALEIHIKAATPIDGGRYTCKAESDQFKGEDGKTSNQIDLKVIYLSVTFQSEADIAVCTAEGHPMPSTIIINKDGKMIKKGESTVSVMITEEICQSNITCYAENGEVNVTESLKTCYKDLNVKFESEAGIATCTAEGHPMPSSVMIYIDGKMIDKGEVEAKIVINEEICQSNITCYAENGEFNATESLEICNTDESISALLVALIVVIAIFMLLWVLLLLYFIYCKNIEMAGEDVTAAEGDPSLVMSRNYRPSIAHFESIQWDKNEEEAGSQKWKTQGIGSSPKLFSSRCCFYFCGPCCSEYRDDSFFMMEDERVEMGRNHRRSQGRTYEVLEMQENDCGRGIGDGQATDILDCPESSAELLAEPPAEVPKPREENETHCDEDCKLLPKDEPTLNESTLNAVTDKKELDEEEQASSSETTQMKDEPTLNESTLNAVTDKKGLDPCEEEQASSSETTHCDDNWERLPLGELLAMNESTLNAVTDKKRLDSCEEAATTEPPTTAPPTTVVTTEDAATTAPPTTVVTIEEAATTEPPTTAPPTTVVTTEDAATTAPPTTVVTIEEIENASGRFIRDDNTHEPHHSNTDRCSVTTNGRGTISLKISKPVRSDEGEYKCRIVRGRQQYPHVKNVHVYWIKMVQEDCEAEEGDEFEMKCRYGPADMPVTKYTWKKVSNDGTSDIDDLSKDSHFQVTPGNKGNYMLKISKVTYADAGKYQCTVVVDGKELVANGRLVVKNAPFKLEIPDVTTNDGINIVKLYLNISAEDKAFLNDISNITWYKGESREKGNMLTSLKSSDMSEHHQTRFEKEKSEASLSFKDVTTKDAGQYFCEVAVKGRQKIYSCSGLLKVEESFLQFVNSRQKSIAGENVNIFCQLSTQRPIKKFIVSKKKFGKLKEVATSDRLIDHGRFEAQCSKEHNGGFLLISKVQISDAGTYHCQCVTEEKIDDEYISYSATSQLKFDVKESIVLNITLEGEQAVLLCQYYIEKKVNVMRWYKKTSNGRQLVSSSKESEMKKKDITKNRYAVTYSDNVTRLEIRNVTVDDAGVYICELETDTRVLKEVIKKQSLKPLKYHASANLQVPWNVFTPDGSTKYRHPAIVFVNSHFLAFCEKNNSNVMLRRGKLKDKSTIEWENPKTILKANDSSFQNLVPIVVDEKKGHVILMCVRTDSQKKKKKKKIVVIKSDDNGNTWGGPNDVHLELSHLPEETLDQYYIGPGHGVCLKSGKLVVSGISKHETSKDRIFVMTSDDGGDTWNVVRVAPSPSNGSLGKHTQIVEYANDQVCITCSLEDYQQRFHVYSNDGCKTFHDAKLEPTLIEANPRCQAGIVSLPKKSDEGFNLIAFTNPAIESKSGNLLLHLSDDGCETWTRIRSLGTEFAEASDLAYYEGKGVLKKGRGLACLFENINNGSDGNDYSILMQLISLDEILQKKSFQK